MSFKRACVGLLGIVLSMVLLAYLFRLPLTSWYLTPMLSKNGAELHCIDWSLTRKLDLNIEKLCLTYQGQQIELAGIIANKQQVSVSRANLIISNQSNNQQPDTSQTEFKKLALVLPEQRPLISIEQLDVVSPFTQNPVRLAIQEKRLNHFTISRDLNADVVISNYEVKANITFDEQVAERFVTLPTSSHFTIQSQIKFDGISAAIESSINASYQHAVGECDLGFASEGQLSAKYQLNQQHLYVDLSALQNQLSAKRDCLNIIADQQHQSFIEAQLPLTWQLHIEKPVIVEDKNLSAPIIKLQAIEGQSEVTVSNTSLSLLDPLTSLNSQVSIDFNSKDIDELKLNAHLHESSVSADFQLSVDSLPAFLDFQADGALTEGVGVKGIGAKGKLNIDELFTSPTAKLNTNIRVKNALISGAQIADFSSAINAEYNAQQHLVVNANSKVKSLTYDDINAAKISNELTLSTDLSVGELFADIDAKTTAAKLSTAELSLNKLSVVSKALQSRALQATHHVFADGFEALVSHNMSEVAHPFELVIPEQAVSKLNPIVAQFESLATVTDGVVSGNIKGDVNLQQAQGRVQISKFSALYNDYLVNDFAVNLNGTFNSGQLNIAATKFTLNELRAGAVVKNIQGQLQVTANQPCAANLTGQVMGGAFVVNKFCPLSDSQTATVKFENIDASKLVTLDAESGISLSGRLAGTLPVVINKQGIEVKQGQLVNQGDGKLLITNNAGFEAVKAQQQELSTTLSLLENLDIKKLRSSVNLKPDGWLHLGVNLEGYNEAQQQAVNFNYNHEENVFTLLRALRLSDEITQKVEKEYAKKGSNDG
ncbi:YdbH domain-containing protein [Pseudoalteromonas sp. bablab_jr010]|uniref:intermembrane phospholipid transport protein YdbH family protein n=1 Tax=Pseudoalteromonas sp. bablab_jr010 TaxID=2755063 RepID=UPI0018F70411|nr:YdbH domain-containing protein [Pseudoalteromonas sp. bablab_jr010]